MSTLKTKYQSFKAVQKFKPNSGTFTSFTDWSRESTDYFEKNSTFFSKVVLSVFMEKSISRHCGLLVQDLESKKSYHYDLMPEESHAIVRIRLPKAHNYMHCIKIAELENITFHDYDAGIYDALNNDCRSGLHNILARLADIEAISDEIYGKLDIMMEQWYSTDIQRVQKAQKGIIAILFHNSKYKGVPM